MYVVKNAIELLILTTNIKSISIRMIIQKNLVGESNFKSLASKYKNKIIIMNISAVGTNSGPDFKMIKCEKKSKGKQYYVAGGVRSLLDIYKLRNIGIDGVLISSLLFKNQTNSFLIKKRAGS